MVTLQASTIRPGLLVALSTSIAGRNVRYAKETIEQDHVTTDGARKARWETERLIVDPAEFEAASKTRSKVRSLIRSACAISAFGLLCPQADEAALEAAVAAARAEADKFNATAKLSSVRVYVIVGRIAADDVEAARAISSEMRDLLAEMETGLKNFDVEMIRDAANRAKSVGAMLSPDVAARVQVAIDAARSSARKLVKAGETGAKEIDRIALQQLEFARTAFLDLDDAKDVAAPQVDARAIDLTPSAEIAQAAPVAAQLEL